MDIISNILESAMRGATKTRLMYGAYLSYSQLREYLTYLEQKQLITFDEEAQLYKLTEKGMHYLNIYDQVRDLFSLGENSNKSRAQVESGPAEKPVSIFTY